MSVPIHDDFKRKMIISNSVPNRVSTKLPPQKKIKTNGEVGNDKTLNPLSQGKKIRIDVEVRNGKTIPHWQRKFTQDLEFSDED